MATKSMIIESVGNAGANVGKKYQKTMTFINPNVSNEVAGTFAQMANALTTNVYKGASIVKKMSVSEEDAAGKPIPTLTIDENKVVTYTGDGSLGVVNGELIGRSEGDIQYTVLQPSGKGVVYALETANFAPAVAEFNV